MHGKPYPTKPAEALEWANSFETSKNYLAKINGDKARKAQYLNLYCIWANLNPEELILLKMNPDPNHYVDAEKLLDRFATSSIDLPESSRWNVSNTVRGFFTKNYHRLEQAGKIEYVTQKTQHTPSKHERFDLYRSCYHPRDKALIMVPLCSAIALDTLSHLSYSMFENDWLRQDIPHISISGEFLKGHGKGKYRGTRQETFITPECKRTLIEYREWYTKTFNYVWHRDDYVFLDIRQNIGKRLDRFGIVAAVRDVKDRANLSFGVHDGRRVVQTALENAGCPPNWVKKIKGRKVSGEESPYSKPCIEQLRAKYREALGELEFLGAGFKSDSVGLTDEEIKIAKTFVDLIKSGDFELKRKGS